LGKRDASLSAHIMKKRKKVQQLLWLPEHDSDDGRDSPVPPTAQEIEDDVTQWLSKCKAEKDKTSAESQAPTEEEKINNHRLQDGVFRFLELPPELRDIVYRQLLTLRRCPKPNDDSPSVAIQRCHPEILACSRQILNEAKSILYEENSPTISLHYPEGIVHCEDAFTVDGLRIVSNVLKFELVAAPWPRYLLSVKTLHLEIAMADPPPVQHWQAQYVAMTSVRLNKTLYDLVDFLRESKKLEPCTSASRIILIWFLDGF